MVEMLKCCSLKCTQKWVHPDDTAFAAAAAGADWFSVPGMGLSIVDQRGDAVWLSPRKLWKIRVLARHPAP